MTFRTRLIRAAGLAIVSLGLFAACSPPTEEAKLTAELKKLDLNAEDLETTAIFDSLVATYPITVFERAAEKGDARAAALLGEVYYEGRLVEENLPRAGDLFEQSCKAKEPLGCIFHATMLMPDHEETARAALQTGCDGKNTRACIYLATMMDEGTGGPQDEAGAMEIFETACKSGYQEGCFKIGIQKVVERTDEADIEARAIFDKACTNDHGESCHYLGLMNRKGTGGQVNAQRALFLLDKACKLGEEEACSDLAETQDMLR